MNAFPIVFWGTAEWHLILVVETEDLIPFMIDLNDDRTIWAQKNQEMVPPGSFLLSVTFINILFPLRKDFPKWVKKLAICQLYEKISIPITWSHNELRYTPIVLINERST